MKMNSVRGRFLLGKLFLVVLSAVSVAGQSGVDPTFNAAPSNPLPTDANFNFQQVVQPDGKVIVYGAPFVFINGELRSGIFRLNQDGTTDTTFVYNNEGGVGISNVAIAPDGKIILAGSTSPNHAKMVRLNPDGSLDNSFSVLIQAVGPPEFTGNWLEVDAVQPDGKVIATHGSWGNIQGTWYSYSMKRYNVDGSVDTTFGAPNLDGGHLVSTTGLVELLPDGRFYLAITSRSHLGGTMSLSRRLANGSADPTYAPFTTTIFPNSFLIIGDLSVASDGGVLATGVFQQTAVGFPPVQQLRKWLPDGAAASFPAPTVFSGGGVHQLPDGKVLYSASGGNATRPLMRLNTDGSIDNTYTMDLSITSIKNVWQVDTMNRVVLLANTAAGPKLVRLLENGSIDPSFHPLFGSIGSVQTTATQADGKIIVAGSFTGMGAFTRNQIARLNADGSVDLTFDPGAGFAPQPPRQLLIQPDGKILAVGQFNTYNGAATPAIVRLNTDGSRDLTFSTTISSVDSVMCIARQPDGKFVIGGTFSVVNGVSRVAVARLNENGDLDTSFNAGLAGSTAPFVRQLVIEPDGKITIGGVFTSVNGVSRLQLARLDSSGNADLAFNANTPQLIEIRTLARQPDGKYAFLDVGAGKVARRNSDGSVDSSFNSPSTPTSGFIDAVLLMPDGTFLVGGRFSSISGSPRSNLMRLKWNGALDQSFTTGVNGDVASITASSNGKVFVSGLFTTAGNLTRVGIARLNVTPLVRTTPFDFDGDQRADISVFRASTNRWYEVVSATGLVHEETFGLAGDIPVPADFDGDGITDEAIFRPSTATWWYKSSINGAQLAVQWGAAGDIPRPSDFDGDGKADFVLFRQSNNTWLRYGSTVGGVSDTVFGLAGDQPLTGDFDGDGKSDLAIFRPSSGDWWYAATSAGGAFRTAHWGQNGDIPVPADYDADGRTDFAIFRPSDGGWYIYNSSNGSFTIMAFGTVGDRPVAGDYDGDGRADLAVFRPSNGIWYILQSTSGFIGYHFGISTDTPLPGTLIP